MSNEKNVIDRVETQNLRDYFAAHALAALIGLIGKSSNRYEIAQWAYNMADVMLETRTKPE